MLKDPLRGKSFDFVFTDGQMAGKTFAHFFGTDGTVTFSSGGPKHESGAHERPKPGVKYTFRAIRDRIYAISYRSDGGYTLTAIMDFETQKLVAFVSNEKMNEVQQGIFEETGASARNGRGDRVASAR
ncbi:MAG: MoaF-related domain-containing protein [Polyangiaceae bacterium]